MQDKNIQVRIDEKSKTEFLKIIKKTGLPASQIIRMFIQNVIERKALPFDIKL